MTSTLQQQLEDQMHFSNRGMVSAVISLYDSLCFRESFYYIPTFRTEQHRRVLLKRLLTQPEYGINLSEEVSEYWLDWFKI